MYVSLSCGADRFGGRLKGGWADVGIGRPHPCLSCTCRGVVGPTAPLVWQCWTGRLPPRVGGGRKLRQAAACCPAAVLQRWMGRLSPRVGGGH